MSKAKLRKTHETKKRKQGNTRKQREKGRKLRIKVLVMRTKIEGNKERRK
jgi:hypothetical protein